ncbi:MAG TPA: hypothetical protein DDW52_03205, partial [Planctomycetaceae bacterium]|nr:hypothetical protein [Planctomycetaceae bacterium]
MNIRLLIGVVAICAALLAGYIAFLRPTPDTPSDVESQISHTGPLGVGTKSQESGTGGESLESGAEHALEPLLKMAEALLVDFRNTVVDYEATMIKRERINGSLGAESTMQAKIRCRDREA